MILFNILTRFPSNTETVLPNEMNIGEVAYDMKPYDNFFFFQQIRIRTLPLMPRPYGH